MKRSPWTCAALVLLLAACQPDTSPPLRVVGSTTVPAGYAITGFAPDGDGGWVAATPLSRSSTQTGSGIVGRLDTDGHISWTDVGPALQYPQDIVVDGRGLVWYAKVTAHGFHPTVDSGPAMTDPTSTLEWLNGTDAAVHTVPLPDPADRLRVLVADSDDGVWYVAYRPAGDVYGHASADGRISEYAAPAGLAGIAPAADGTVWLTTAQGCEILRVRPADGTVLARTRDETDNGYRAECTHLVPDDGGVLVPQWNRFAVVTADGHQTTRDLPAVNNVAEPDTIPPAPVLALASGGAVWAARANTVPVVLLRVGADGTTTSYPTDLGGTGRSLGLLYAGRGGTLWAVGTDWITRLSYG
ncbi:NHL repeat-containing protein [Hamadaea tsunoensis]|uniref:hypothetical protein n=1 Tax=Hamadaea tsunoensis TaxID=53368 RepID=UPI0003F75D3A|nr:hypothetical protein [Hamadaea tsunoensis]